MGNPVQTPVAPAVATPSVISTIPVATPLDPVQNIQVVVDRKQQFMTVSVNGSFVPEFVWLVSSGRPHMPTPVGEYTPHWMAVRHRSKHYHHASMPYAINFFDGDAIHATTGNELAQLGTPVSHGCVRIAPENAALLYGMVQQVGMKNLTIIIED